MKKTKKNIPERYVRNRYYSNNDKTKSKESYEITKKDYKNKHEIVTEIFLKKRNTKKRIGMKNNMSEEVNKN